MDFSIKGISHALQTLADHTPFESHSAPVAAVPPQSNGELSITGKCTSQEEDSLWNDWAGTRLGQAFGADKNYETGMEYQIQQGGKTIYTVRTDDKYNEVSIYTGEQTADASNLVKSIYGYDFADLVQSAKEGTLYKPAQGQLAYDIQSAGDGIKVSLIGDKHALWLDIPGDAFTNHASIHIGAGRIQNEGIPEEVSGSVQVR